MNTGQIVGIVVGGTISMIFLGYLMAPVITDLTKEGGALAEWAPLVTIIPVVVLVVVIVMVIYPILGKRGL